jgi:hypothetical protein
MRNMTKIALLLGALALPAYADPPASTPSAATKTGHAAKHKAKAKAPAKQDSAPATDSADADAHRLDATGKLGAPADDGSTKLGAKARVKAGSSSDSAGARTKADGSKDYRVDVDAKDSKAPRSAVNGGINPNHDEDKVGTGASVTGDDKVDASSAPGEKRIHSNTGASAGNGAGAGAEIDDTGAGSGHH